MFLARSTLAIGLASLLLATPGAAHPCPVAPAPAEQEDLDLETPTPGGQEDLEPLAPTDFSDDLQTPHTCQDWNDPPPPPPPPPPACARLSADSNQSGVTFALHENSMVENFTQHLYERRKWRGSLLGWSGSDKSYNDIFSSAWVAQGCLLTVYNDAGRTGASQAFIGTAAGGSTYELIVAGFNDITSSATCSCGPGPVLPIYVPIQPL